MPRGISDKVVRRVNEIYDYMSTTLCVTESEVSVKFGLSSTEAYYVLNFMTDKGLIKKITVGTNNVIYCMKYVTPIEVYNKWLRYYVHISLEELWKIVCSNVTTFKTKYAWVTVNRLTSVHVGRRKIQIKETNYPKLQSALVDIIRYILADAVIEVKNERKTMFKIDVEKAKERCL
jgi:DNA-binding Lrp family transcriptional regulator